MEKMAIDHPGSPNDPWDWLKTVADAMIARSDRRFPFMLDHAYKAYLSDGVGACFRVVESYDFVLVRKGE